MLIQPIDYFLVGWFALAAALTAYVALDQYRNNSEPTVMKWDFMGDSGVTPESFETGLARTADASHCENDRRSIRLFLVRHSPVQFWFVICLLVVRLVLGEFAHAMPHQAGAPSVSVSSGEATACPGHAHASSDGASMTGQHSPHEKPASQTKDCCKASGCQCPCLHASVIVSSSSMVVPVSLDRSATIICTLGPVQDRIDRLFRPPA
jgi:hypothetical protein